MTELQEYIEDDPGLVLVEAVWAILDKVDGSVGWVHEIVDGGIKSWMAAHKRYTRE